MKRFFLLKWAFLLPIAALAQPSNDYCDKPIALPDVTAWCSSVGQFTNATATDSNFPAATCMASTEKDVWFSFVAQFTDIIIDVRGKTASSPGGTLQNPEIALYIGDCNASGGNLSELECTTDASNFNIVELYKGGLFVGATYLIRIQGAGGNVGTFQICLNNYNPPVDPKGDCPKSAILCDKSPFFVKNITGGGAIQTELNDATCFSNGVPGNYETNSTWFSWTCSKAGPLEFTLTPTNATDDLDFAVYELPNGLKNCAGKILKRCMAAGDFTFPSPCMGPTGLRAGETDTEESAGCGAGKDNFIAPLDMELGKSYCLVVNNFTLSGNGFNIEWGGTGEFLGPVADFTTNPKEVCLGIPIVFTDASTFAIGAITKYGWNFGIDATPQTATGKGPHSVQFGKPGVHSIVMTLETDLGCKVTDIQTVLVHPPVEIDTVLSVPDCNGGTNGQIEITNITSGTPPYEFSWNGGPFQTGVNKLSNLPNGIYNVKIKDKNLCETSFDIRVHEKELTVAPDILQPLCTGDANGQILLNITNGTAPYTFTWTNQPGTGQNPRINLPAGVYTVSATDGELCKGLFQIQVDDHPPVTVEKDSMRLKCFGSNDGSAAVVPMGGVGNYSFMWSGPNGSVGGSNPEISSLPPGQYRVTVADGNGCTTTTTVFVEEPSPLSVVVTDIKNLTCATDKNGVFHVEGIGGSVPYTFSADGQSFVAADSLTGLMAGRYTIFVKDSSGCVDSTIATIGAPPPLLVHVERDTTLELGYTLDVVTAVSPVFRPVDYLWMPPLGLNCFDCAEPIITPTESTTYVLKITDEDGCMATDSLRILVTKTRPIYIPNALAPEKNSPNDHFTAFGGPGADKINFLRIFDRWGNLVFEKHDFLLNDPYIGWDGVFRGKLVDSGVFAFVAEIHFIDGESIIFKGDLTVIR